MICFQLVLCSLDVSSIEVPGMDSLSAGACSDSLSDWFLRLSYFEYSFQKGHSIHVIRELLSSVCCCLASLCTRGF